MKYRIRHTTEYLYSDQVSHCYNVAHLIPRNTERQQCLNSSVKVAPFCASSATREDYFGNQAYYFEIQQAHKKLVITVTSEVSTGSHYSQPQLDLGITCKEARMLIEESNVAELLLAKEFLFDSPMIASTDALREYAAPSFADDKSLLAAVMDLTQRIFTEFTYCPESTNVATPLSEVLEKKRGVCQDFAHLQIGCLRALGYPAKYVSGYIETLPPPGQEKLVGSDASHAWISVYSPIEGWVEFDPTNNCIASDQHIVTAWGRDYLDVTPLRGVIFGGGEQPLLKVSVDVARL